MQQRTASHRATSSRGHQACSGSLMQPVAHVARGQCFKSVRPASGLPPAARSLAQRRLPERARPLAPCRALESYMVDKLLATEATFKELQLRMADPDVSVRPCHLRCTRVALGRHAGAALN